MPKLAEDHANAEYLAAGLRGLKLEVQPPQTNMVYLDIPARHAAGLGAHLERSGILATVKPRTRLVTHLDVSRPKVDTVLRAFHDYPHWNS